MKWPQISELTRIAPFPDGYTGRSLCRQDIPLLIESITQWYPDISVGGASCYLMPDFYENKVSLEGEEDKSIYVLMIWHSKELAGFFSLQWEALPQAIYGRIGIVSHAHRSAGLASTALQMLELIGCKVGAGFIYGMATLKIPHMQMALESLGYRLLGFAPGYDREINAKGEIKRVFEAYYAKTIVPDDELLIPDPAKMTPQARKLFETMFPEYITG